jgi:hypothetical protein
MARNIYRVGITAVVFAAGIAFATLVLRVPVSTGKTDAPVATKTETKTPASDKSDIPMDDERIQAAEIRVPSRRGWWFRERLFPIPIASRA